MMLESIVSLAKKMGQISDEEDELLRPLCGAAEAEILRRRKPTALRNECESALVLAGALLALSSYLLTQGMSAPSSFSAGELSMRFEPSADTAKRAHALRLDAERIMGPYVFESSFAFRGVEST